MTSNLALIGLVGLVSFGLWRLSSTPEDMGVLAVQATPALPQGGDVNQLAPVDAAIGGMTASAPFGGRSALIGTRSQPTTQRATVEIEVAGLLGPAIGAVVIPHQRFNARRASSLAAGQGMPQPESGPTEFTSEFTTDENGQLILEVAPSTQSTLLFTWPTSSWVQQVTWTSPRPGVIDALKVRFPLAELDRELRVQSFPSGVPIEGALAIVGSASAYTVPKDGKALESDRLGVLRVPSTQGPTRDPYIITVSAEEHSSVRIKSTDQGLSRQTAAWLPKYAQLRGVVAQSGGLADTLGYGDAEVFLVPRDAVRESYLGKSTDEREFETADSRTLDTNQIYERVKVNSDGSWIMPSVKFESTDATLNDYVLLVGSMLRGRLIAEGLFVGPGDELVIEDPMLQGPRLDLKFLLSDGRPALSAGGVLFSREPTGAAPLGCELLGTVGPKGYLSFPGFPPGTWQWRIRTPGATGEPTGTFEHGSAEPTKLTVKLEGHTDIEGRVLNLQLDSTFVYWHAVGTPKSAYGTGIVNAHGEFRIPLVPVLSTVRLMPAIRQPWLLRKEKEPQPRWPDDVVTVNIGDQGLRNVVLSLPDFNQPKDDTANRFQFQVNGESSQR